jgi:anti-sigma regulatory factor (Ser/Thr protein kinase)
VRALGPPAPYDRLVSSAVMSLRPEPSSARQARRYVAEQLVALGYPDAAPAAELLVTELVTNAVLHARTPVVVSVEPRGPMVRVEVADDSPRTPRPRKHSVDSGTGRGLVLVDRMSDDWGVELRDGGKVVWFELCREPTELTVDLDAWDDI